MKMVRHPAVRLPALRLLLQSSPAAPQTACCYCSCCSCITFRRCCCCPAASLLASPRRHSYLSSIFLSRRAAAPDATTNAVAAAAVPRRDRICFAVTGAAAAAFPCDATAAGPPPGLCAAAAATAAGCPLEIRTFPPAFLRARAAAFSAGASPPASAAVSATAGEGSAAAGPPASTAVSATAAAAACAASATRHLQQQLLRQHPTIVRRCSSAHCQRHAAGSPASSLAPPLHRSLSPRARLGAAGFTAAWAPAPYRCTYTLATPFSFSSPSRSRRLHQSRSGGDAAPLLPFFGCRTLLSAFPLQPPATRAAALGAPAALAAAASLPAAAGPTPLIAATAPASADSSVAYAAATIGPLPLLRCSVARGSSQTDGRRSADAAAASASPVVAVAPAAAAALSTIVAFVRAAGCLKALSAAVYIRSAAAAGAPLGRPAVAARVAAACGPGVAAFSTAAAAGRPAAGAASPDTACRQLHATAAGSVLPAADLYTAAFAAMKEELARSSSVSSESQSSGKSTAVYSQRFSQLLFDYLMGLSLTLPLSSSKPLPPFLPPVIAATQQLLLPAPASLSEGSSSGRSVAADAASGAHLHTHQLQRLRSLEAPAAAALLLFVAVLRCRSGLSVPPRNKDATGTAATATSSAATGERGRIPAAGEAAEAADQNTGQYKLPRLLLLHTLAELGAALSLREAQLTPQHLVLLRVALELLQGEERSSARRQRTNSGSSGSNAECEDLLLLQQLRGHGGALGAVAADFYELLPLHPAVFAEQLSKEDVKAAAREDEEEEEEDDREKEEEEAAAEDQRGEYGVAEDFRDPQGVLDDADAGAEAADIEEKDKLQGSKHGSGSGAGDSSSSSNSSTRTGRPSKEILHEISAALSRLEKSHDVLPTYIGPFLFTLRNSAKKELYVCLKQKDFFVNEPERLLPKEEWRYRIAQQRGWRVILVAAEQAWLQLPSAAAKLQYVERALLQPKPVL